jgi:tRNA-specific 2-thiouridylase
LRCLAQIRYNSSAAPAVAQVDDAGRLHVAFDAPCHGVAPGQAVVLYDDDRSLDNRSLGDRVLGGGWIV